MTKIYTVIEMYKGLIHEVRAFDNEQAADERAMQLGEYDPDNDTGSQIFVSELKSRSTKVSA